MVKLLQLKKIRNENMKNYRQSAIILILYIYYIKRVLIIK